MPGASEQQQQCLDQLDFRHAIFERLMQASIAREDRDLLGPPRPYGTRRRSVDRLIDPLRIAHTAADIVKSARQEVLAHAYWSSIPEVRTELAQAPSRGVRCTLLGQTRQDPRTAEILPVDHPSAPVVLLVDGTGGLAIEPVQLTTPGGRNLPIILASLLAANRVAQWHQELLPSSSPQPVNAS